jgi:mannose-1-phosphate guanylyltransferase
MKAFLLAAGQGTRLRPLTDTMPKCLVPIRGVPMLGIWLQLCEHFGIGEVLVNLHHHAEAVAEYLAKLESPVHVHLSSEPVLLGSAGTLRANRRWVQGEDRFWIFYADVLTAADLARILALHDSRKPAATLGLYQVPDPRRCGVITFDGDGVVRDFVEKPDLPASNWAFAGIMIGTPTLLDAIPPSQPADLGFDVLPRLVGRMLACPLPEYLVDIGTMENYHAAQSNWPGLEGAQEGKYATSRNF